MLNNPESATSESAISPSANSPSAMSPSVPSAPGHRDRNVRPTGPTAARIRVVCCLIGGAGLVLVIVGSFLPWVVSGTVRRSSYAIVGLLSRLGIGEDGPIGALIAGWPLIGVLCMTPVIAAAIRWWRVAGVLAVLVSLAAALLSFGVIAVTAGRSAAGLGSGVGVDPIGPSVMAAGAVLLFVAGLALALGAGSPVRRGTGQLSANKQQ